MRRNRKGPNGRLRERGDQGITGEIRRDLIHVNKYKDGRGTPKEEEKVGEE